MHKLLTYATHAVVWILLLVIPYISTDQVFDLFLPGSGAKYLLLSLAQSMVLIAGFYFNFLVLIPVFLLTRRYWQYSLAFLLVIVVISVSCSAFFLRSDFNPEMIGSNVTVIEKVIPVIIINIMSLWFLCNILAVLWTVYNRLKQMETEKHAAQIASLKSQINPHFLFNTLNNIYATAIDTSPRAADMVDKLSEMMRYTMKDIQQDTVALEDEIQYVSNFIELQRIRLDSNVMLDFKVPEIVPPLRIAPMLLIPFIENAFKHGVNSEQESDIRISVTINGSDFRLEVFNRKVDVQRQISERSGLGIENTRHRLELTYPSRHRLEIRDRDNDFFVSLHITLQ